MGRMVNHFLIDQEPKYCAKVSQQYLSTDQIARKENLFASRT